MQVWSKSALGIPEDAFLFVSAANYFKIIPEMREAWARLLAAVPGSRLLLHPFNQNWSTSYPVKRFCTEFEAVLTRHGVDHNRLIVSTMDLPSRSDLCSLIGAGDLYLDTSPFAGVNSIVDPLEAGVPVVAWEGCTMRARMGAALLRSVGLDALISSDAAGYVSLALDLATNSQKRAEVSAQIKVIMERGPVFLDTLAASDAFGDLIESAYDELAEHGAQAFRKRRTPVRAVRATPLTGEQRRAHGNELLAQGRADRAVIYLMAALQQDNGTASLWLDLAKAFRANGQTNEAIQAMEAGLRLDESLVAGWEMLADLADQAGNTDLTTAARGIIASLKPKPKANISGVLGKLRAAKTDAPVNADSQL
ncbi:MAG: tetratricopeptide repeat protein [Opitutus sp.]|nr:tetratricopeptide repeat protein [Opitutus sp.]MCS6274290.1 tetratricopeptide repeat protein [Opitutus sp.]